MKCKKIRGLITSYIDGELNLKLEETVREHLKTCSDCRKLEEELRKLVLEPFKETERISPPQELWSKIKSSIQKQPQSAFLGLIQKIIMPFPAIKPALAFATITALLIVGITTFRMISLEKQRIINLYLEEQVEFINYLSGENGQGDYENGFLGLDTSIEEFLL